MGHGDLLWELLRPMGPYRQRGIYSGGELESEGQALDAVQSTLELLEREAFLDTAESFGLSRWESLLAMPLAAGTPEERRTALAALFCVGGDSFTLAAINDNLKNSGLDAVVSETDQPGLVEVRFPHRAGVPQNFEELKYNIENILPCHLEIRYIFRAITWGQLEAKFSNWFSLERSSGNWGNLESMV